MNKQNLDSIKMAKEIGDNYRGVLVVGKTKEETMTGLRIMFEVTKGHHRTETE